jgi:hypothetical protein
VILVGRDQQLDPPELAAMRWWTSRGPRASFQRDEQGKLLLQLATQWRRWVLHVFDQGKAFSFWLGLLFAFLLRFVLRWKKEYQLVDAQGNRRAAWKIARGKGGWQERTVWDCRHHRWVRASILALPVRHPDHLDQPLWLVIAHNFGGLPWYLLTNEPITGAQDAWGMMFAYARSFQMELTWRENKSELAFHSPRLWRLRATGETPAPGDPGLCVSAHPVGTLLRPVAALVAAPLLSPHGSALPPGTRPLRTSAPGPESALAGLSPALAAAGSSPRGRYGDASLTFPGVSPPE